MINKIHLGDCLEIMKSIDDNSIDMILCDLPYGTTQNKWDSIIPLDKLWKQYDRIIKVSGAIVLTGQGLFSSKVILNNEKHYRYTLIWEKTKAGGFLNSKRMPLQAHEDILIFYKKLPTYNPQMQQGKPYTKKSVTNGDGNNYGKFDRVGKTSVNEGVRYPRSVLKMANANQGSVHPTQKPVKLFEWLIKTYTNEGETILDNCIGSGTTAIAAINTNRNWIGIEKDKTYFEVANKRIVDHMKAVNENGIYSVKM